MSERKFIGGFNMAGVTESLESRIKQAHAERTTKCFRYVEIGIATGRTLLSTAELCRELCNHESEWQVVGVDLVNGAYFDPREFFKQTLAFDAHIETQSGRQNHFIADKITPQIRVLLLKSDTVRAQVSNGCVNFCLIDGCHGAPCVMADFLAIEHGMAKGGIVAFHDAGPEEQRNCFQPHCGAGIGVVEALKNLSLACPPAVLMTMPGEPPPNPMGVCFRPDWKFIGFTPGDRETDKNPEAIGHGMAFFQKL